MVLLSDIYAQFDSCQFILIRMAYEVLISPRLTFDISLHEVCVRWGYATSKPNFLGWIVYQIFLPMVLLKRTLRARESSATKSHSFSFV